MRKHLSTLLVLAAAVQSGLADSSPPEPGPENGGLRLRLMVANDPGRASEGFAVRLDLLNATNRAITLRAGWGYEADLGDFKAYVEAAASIETYPAIAPWVGQIMADHRQSPQPEYLLPPGEVLSVNWQTAGRRLKNQVTNPLEVQNPEFPFPGLYSVHVTLALHTSEGPVLLRSNEQLVTVGGSRELPKHAYGTLWGADAQRKSGTLSLGSLHKVARGDRFQLAPGIGQFWKLTITDVFPNYSTGRIEPSRPTTTNSTAHIPKFPERGTSAVLMVP